MLHRGASRPIWEETVPNLVPEAEKKSDSALCSDSRNTANASENPCPDTSDVIVEDVDLKAIGNKNLQAVASSYCGGANVKECCRRLHGS